MRAFRRLAIERMIRALDKGPRTTCEVARETGYARLTVIRDLDAAEEEGLVQSAGGGGRPITWRIP